MAKYFTNRLFIFKSQLGQSENKAESEISSHITLMSVIAVYSILDIFIDVVCW